MALFPTSQGAGARPRLNLILAVLSGSHRKQADPPGPAKLKVAVATDAGPFPPRYHRAFPVLQNRVDRGFIPPATAPAYHYLCAPCLNPAGRSSRDRLPKPSTSPLLRVSPGAFRNRAGSSGQGYCSHARKNRGQAVILVSRSGLLGYHESPLFPGSPQKRPFHFRLVAVAGSFAMDLLLCFFPWSLPCGKDHSSRTLKLQKTIRKPSSTSFRLCSAKAPYTPAIFKPETAAWGGPKMKRRFFYDNQSGKPERLSKDYRPNRGRNGSGRTSFRDALAHH